MSAEGKTARGRRPGSFFIRFDELKGDYGRLIGALISARIEAEYGCVKGPAAAELAELSTYRKQKQLKLARAWLVRQGYLKADGTFGREYARASKRHQKRIDAREAQSWANLQKAGAK